MRKNSILILLVLCQAFVFAQDKKVMKIAKYIEKGKGTEAKELLDELDGNKEYQSDIYYWYVRTVYYRNIALASTNNTNEIAEARKSFEKLVELDKTDPSKSFTQYIPQIKKDLYEGKNLMTKSTSSSQSGNVNQANDGKTVTLTQIGQGKTKDEAKYNALRNAIEKAFGTFISSNTTLLNDELVKDEIVSVSSGNIQNFEILLETQMPDGSYSSLVKTTVSIGNLSSFCENKGIAVEFKGEAFAANIKLQELNKRNEESVINNLKLVTDKILKMSYNYTLVASEPILATPTYGKPEGYAFVPITVTCTPNSNIKNAISILLKTLEDISLKESEVESYTIANSSFYKIVIDQKPYFLRSKKSVSEIIQIVFCKIPEKTKLFTISNGIFTNSCQEIIDCIHQNGRSYGSIGQEYDYNEKCNYWWRVDNKTSQVTIPLESGFNYVNRSLIKRVLLNELRGYDDGIEDLIKFGKFHEAGVNNITCSLSYFLHAQFSYNIRNYVSVDALSKINEYKVQPVQ